MLHLRAFCDGNADAVVAHWKYRHAEFEQGLKLLPRFHAHGTAHIGEVAVIAEQRLAKPILDVESDDRVGDVGVGLTTHAERNVFAAHAPGQALAVGASKLYVDDGRPALAKALARRAETAFISERRMHRQRPRPGQ